MSNVEYRCPYRYETGQRCGARLFAPPGGTPHHCMHHPDTVYQQVEDYQGPNFEYVAEDEKNPAKTGVATFGAEHVTQQVVDIEPPALNDEELLFWYRDQYLRVTGKRPDMRWGLETVKSKLVAWEEEHTPPPEKVPGEEDVAGGEEGEKESVEGTVEAESEPVEVTQ